MQNVQLQMFDADFAGRFIDVQLMIKSRFLLQTLGLILNVITLRIRVWIFDLVLNMTSFTELNIFRARANLNVGKGVPFSHQGVPHL